MINDALVYPMLAHVLLVFALYGLLTVARAPSVWGIGALKDGSNPWKTIEPRISANLSNQFEWPLFFYVVSLIAIVQGMAGSAILVWLSWLFVGGRIFHSGVQILTTNIRLRGLVFTINFLAVLGMWVCVAFTNVT